MENLASAPQRTFNLNLFMCKLDRWAAWVLLVVMLAYAITGYGMTKGLIDQDLARSWHLGWLGGLGLVAFIIHTAWAIHLSFKRWRIWNWAGKAALLLFYLILLSFFIFVHFFYPLASSKSYQSTSSNLVTNNNVVATTQAVFDATSLSVYNGLQGQPAYAAVDGVVYDFSRLFRNGKHAGHSAGQDLSAAFHSEHPESFLNKYQVVGTYSK
jgi:predicted heme/steroid binding protein